jgi:aminomethyltransferase
MYPYDVPDAVNGDSLWELGLTFTVSPGKTNFRGAERHFALQGKERIKIFGVLLDTDQAAEGGDELWSGGERVGLITCALFSCLSKRSMAIARLKPSAAVQGTPLEVRGGTCSARPSPTRSRSMIRRRRSALPSDADEAREISRPCRSKGAIPGVTCSRTGEMGR